MRRDPLPVLAHLIVATLFLVVGLVCLITGYLVATNVFLALGPEAASVPRAPAFAIVFGFVGFALVVAGAGIGWRAVLVSERLATAGPGERG